MKTIQELYNEVMANEELKAQCIEAANANKLEAFLKEQGCEATMEEVQAFLEAKQQEDAPLSFDELENAAGGCSEATEIGVSIGTLGLGCVGMALQSAVCETRHVGMREGDEGRLCNPN